VSGNCFIAAPEFVEHQNLQIPAFDVPGYEIHRATTIIIAPTGGVKVNGSAPRSLEALGIRDIQIHVPFFVSDRQVGPRPFFLSASRISQQFAMFARGEPRKGREFARKCRWRTTRHISRHRNTIVEIDRRTSRSPVQVKRSETEMARKIITHLMFEGVAEEAMNFYVSPFAGSEIKQVDRYGPGEPGAEGTVKTATFRLAGQEFLCIDSPVKHAFTFTPSISLFVDCESEAELERVFTQLSAGGQVLMPVANYGFSTKFGWTNDRFGVSWQLNLP
jgi:predicted 3-demethylubiquinone-9 3-methyltransferase (glyoxalase superfamily)